MRRAGKTWPAAAAVRHLSDTGSHVLHAFRVFTRVKRAGRRIARSGVRSSGQLVLSLLTTAVMRKGRLTLEFIGWGHAGCLRPRTPGDEPDLGLSEKNPRPRLDRFSAARFRHRPSGRIHGDEGRVRR